MPMLSTIRALLPIFAERPWASLGLVALVVSSSLLEGVGIGFLVPLLESLDRPGEVASDSYISTFLRSLFQLVGVPYTLWSILLAGFGLFLLHTVLVYVLDVRTALQSEEVTAQKRVRLFHNLLYADLSCIHARKEGELVNGIITECSRVQVAFMNAVYVLAHVVSIAMYLAMALMLSWPLVLAALGLVGIAALGLKRELRKAALYGHMLTEANMQVQHTALEHLGGMRAIRAFNLEEYSHGVFRAQASELPRLRAAIARSRARLVTIFEAIIMACLMVIVYFSVTWARMSIPVLLTFVFILFRLYPKIGGMNKALHQAISTAPGAVAVARLIQATRSPSIRSGQKPFRQLREGVRFERVSFSYDGKGQVLRDVSFTIGRGQMVAIVGASGGGKSTLVNLLMRFYDPTSGRVLVDGTDLRELDLADWRRAVALVDQDVFLFNDTIRNNIAVGKPGASEAEIVAAARRAYAHDFIMELPQGYDTLIGDRGVRLSGGQRQRIALARALVREPQVLILDEATSELDSRSEQLIRQAVEEYARERTIFAIAHRLSTIRHADKILVLEGGRIVEEGDHKSLLQNGQHYAEFLRLQEAPATARG